MGVEVKAETWLHREGHSRVSKVSFWRVSASLSRWWVESGVVAEIEMVGRRVSVRQRFGGGVLTVAMKVLQSSILI